MTGASGACGSSSSAGAFFCRTSPSRIQLSTVRLPSGTALADVLYAAGNLIAR